MFLKYKIIAITNQTITFHAQYTKLEGEIRDGDNIKNLDHNVNKVVDCLKLIYPDFEEIFRFLYENVDEYLPGKAGTAAFLINEHQYKANFRIDKEINVMSLINNLINNK